MSQFVNFTEGELAAEAGGDPWRLSDEMLAGDAGAIDELADAFHQAGMHSKEASDEFEAANRQFEEAYRKNGTEHPINEAAEVQRVKTELGLHPQELSRIAVALERVAAELAVAQRNSDAEVAALEAQLHPIDDQITAAEVDAPELVTGLRRSAVEATRLAVGNLEGIRSAYVSQLEAAETAMMAAGYAPEVLDEADGVPGNGPEQVARRYDQSGQRARDQGLVDAAKARGDWRHLPSRAGEPGFMTAEEAAAASRVRDYEAITDPANGYARTAHVHGDDRPVRYAGQRLDDYLIANSTGPSPKDPVLGGDARTRAQARLALQQDLENGNLSWHEQPMVPDDATQLMNEIEINDRANVLTRLQSQLEQAGMTPGGAAAATESLSQGIVPKELVDGAAAAGKPVAGGAEAFNRYAGAIPVNDWNATEAPFSAQDINALREIGGKLGWAGTAIDLGVGAYEIWHGAPLGEVALKTGGGTAGAMAFGYAGAQLGAVGGPPGIFIGALIGATLGGIGGEAAGKEIYDWFEGK